MANDMTQGNLAKILIRFSIPLICSAILQQLYNWADAFIVGNTEGEAALAAIGSTVSISNIFILIIVGFSTGLSIIAAQLYGNKQEDALGSILSSYVLVFGILFSFLSLIGIFSSPYFLTWIHTPSSIFHDAVWYLRIIFVGMPFLAIYNIYASILRGMGDSKASFCAILVSSVGNVLLDILFVYVLHYSVIGAAFATILSQLAMMIFIICYARRYALIQQISYHISDINREGLLEGCKLGLPVTIQNSISSLGNIVLQDFMNSFGVATVAAITTAYRIDSIILLPIVYLGNAISTITAQNMGAKQYKRAKNTLYIGVGMMIPTAISLTSLVLCFGGSLIALFGAGAEAAQIGTNFFYHIAPFYLIHGLAASLRGYLQGCKDVLYTSTVTVIAFLIRIALSYLLKPYFGNMTIALAEAYSWCVLLFLYIVRYISSRHRNITTNELA